MTTVGEIIQDNSVYDEGILFNRDFYKDALESPQNLVPPEERSFGYRLALLVEIAQRVSSLAFLIIPSCYLLGGAQVLAIAGVAFMQQIVIGSIDRKRGQGGFFEELEKKGSLVACLDFEDKKQWLLAELGYSGVFKVSTYALLKIIPYGKSFLAAAIIYNEFYNIFEALEGKIFSWIETMVHQRREQQWVEML